MKLVYKCMTIFFNFQTTSSHLHSLQVEYCGSNSRLVVDEDDNGKFRPERVKALKYFQVNYGDQRVFSCTLIRTQKIFQGKRYIGAQCGALLVGNAVPIGLTSVQNTVDRVAVKGRQEKLTHECDEGCSGTSRYLRGEYVAGCVYGGLE